MEPPERIPATDWAGFLCPYYCSDPKILGVLGPAKLAGTDLKESQQLVGRGSFVPVPAGTRPSRILWNRCCVPLTSDLKILGVVGRLQHGESSGDLGTQMLAQG